MVVGSPAAPRSYGPSKESLNASKREIEAKIACLCFSKEKPHFVEDYHVYRQRVYPSKEATAVQAAVVADLSY